MYFYTLNEDAIRFIREHENADTGALLLRHKTIFDLPAKFIVEQIIARKKAKIKFPNLLANDRIIFPPTLNIEQSSSEQTALFKKEFIGALGGKLNAAVDLTGGFGIDTMALRNLFHSFDYVEPNEALLKIVAHNFHELGIANVRLHATTAELFIKSSDTHYDLIYLDPSRRVLDKKVVTFHDCLPDVTRLEGKLLSQSDVLLVKAAPLLDIKQALRDLTSVEKVVVLSVKNDCKELLFLCRKGATQEPIIVASNLETAQPDITFTFSEEEMQQVSFSDAKAFIYEPNASILKAGAFKTIGARYQLSKLNPNTHLYTSEQIVEAFPGRVFRMKHVMRPDARSARELLPGRKANVVTRNYPLSADELKKKLNIGDGGDIYILAFTDSSKKVVVAERIS